jgi:hypothetical protein
MAVNLYDQALCCLLARTPNRTADIKLVQEWFKPFMPVTGDMSITEDVGTGGARRVVTHASGLSKDLADLLTGTWLIDVEFGKVIWKDREADLSEF